MNAERSFWRAVLEQAYEDAEMLALDGLPGTEPFECARTRRYLRADSPLESGDLRLVCELADVPADRVIVWARWRYPPEQTVDTNVECTDEASDFSASMTAQIQ